MRLESKDKMRTRGIKSPDLADALVLAFYNPVVSVYLKRGLLLLDGRPEVKEIPERSNKLITIGGSEPDAEEWADDGE